LSLRVPTAPWWASGILWTRNFFFEAWDEDHTPFWLGLPLNASTYVVERLFAHPESSRVPILHHDLTRHWNGRLVLWCIVAGSIASSPPTIQATTHSNNGHTPWLPGAGSLIGWLVRAEVRQGSVKAPLRYDNTINNTFTASDPGIYPFAIRANDEISGTWNDATQALRAKSADERLAWSAALWQWMGANDLHLPL